MREVMVQYLQHRLLKWFDENHRVFPWREDQVTKYQQIVSEILLQRTKAETVAKYYDTFFSKFPDWNALAHASLEELEEIMKPHQKVKALTGKDMILFRPPYGDYNNTLIQTLKGCNYYGIQWDVDSLDWKDYDASTIIRKVTEHKHLGNGSIILCHNGAKHTAEALDEMIRTLKGKGYELVPVSQLILKDNYTIRSDGRQCPGK